MLGVQCKSWTLYPTAPFVMLSLHQVWGPRSWVGGTCQRELPQGAALYSHWKLPQLGVIGEAGQSQAKGRKRVPAAGTDVCASTHGPGLEAAWALGLGGKAIAAQALS